MKLSCLASIGAALFLLILNSSFAGGAGSNQHRDYDCIFGDNNTVHVVQNDDHFRGTFAFSGDYSASTRIGYSYGGTQTGADHLEYDLLSFGPTPSQGKLTLYLPLGRINHIKEVRGVMDGVEGTCAGEG